MNTATAEAAPATDTAESTAIVLTPAMFALLPHNPTTAAPYCGKNLGTLLEAAIEAGRECGEWAGFHQWADAGRMVRKGETATRIVQVRTKKGEAADGSDDSRYVKHVAVFHIGQTDELSDDERSDFLAKKAARKAARAAKPRKGRKGKRSSSKGARAAA